MTQRSWNVLKCWHSLAYSKNALECTNNILLLIATATSQRAERRAGKCKVGRIFRRPNRVLPCCAANICALLHFMCLSFIQIVSCVLLDRLKKYPISSFDEHRTWLVSCSFLAAGEVRKLRAALGAWRVIGMCGSSAARDPRPKVAILLAERHKLRK